MRNHSDKSGHGNGPRLLDPEFLDCELLTVPPDIASKAAAEISGCEACSDSADLPLDWILCELMNRPGMYEFILPASVSCPLCHGPVTEKTLVDRVGGMEVSIY
jgi:hypothetical protein